MYYDLPLDHPDRGRAFPCDCTKQTWEQRRRRRLLDESGLGALCRHTFETFSLREGEVEPAISANLFDVSEAVREYASKPWPEGWLLLTGYLGSGKTHLAAAAVNHRVSVMSRSALFVFVPGFLDHLRSAFAPSSESGSDSYFERVCLSEFLVLDDLGAEYGTSWATEKLFQLINHRYNSQLPTIFTSNVDPERIEGRIRSRLLDQQLTSRWVVQAPDYRVDAAAPRKTPFSEDDLAQAVTRPTGQGTHKARDLYNALLASGNATPSSAAVKPGPVKVFRPASTKSKARQQQS